MKVLRVSLVLLLAVGMFSTTAIANAPEDVCAGAIPVAINSSSPVLFPCADKTPTGTDGSCVGFGLPQYTGTFDVWVSFVATGTAHRVRTDIGSAGSDSNYGVFAGPCGDPMVEVGCSEDEAAPFLGNICVTGLTPGSTYYVQLGAFCDGCFGACSPDGYVVTVQGNTCGNGAIECGEQCDPPSNCCSATCQNIFVCGDGRLCGTETCDDGNTTSGDGCSATCTREEFCGDNIVNGVEQCDGTGSPQCPAGSYCATNCTCVVGIPAVSEWGLAVLTLIGLVSGTILFGRRRVAAH